MNITPSNGNPLHSGHWSAMPTWHIPKGLLGRMTKAELRVHEAMVAAARWDRGGLLERSIKTLAIETGLHARNVRWAISKLCKSGLIERIHRGRGSSENISRYRMAVTPPDLNRAETPPTTQENRAETPSMVQGKTEPSTGRNQTEYGAKPNQVEGAGAPPITEKEKANSRTAAADELDPRLLDALTVVGIGDPLRSKLAAMPGITPRMIGEEADKVAGRPLVLNKPAIVATNLQTRCQAERQRREQAAAAEQRREREREHEHRAAAADAERDEAGRELLASLADEELAGLTALAMTSHPAHRERWKKQIEQRGLRVAVTNNRGLRAAILTSRAEETLCGTNC